ncbi:tetratricopeptide repeat protein [Marinifilum fragile]|uniref:tetratricopeptide repeat protein n=1 Tax=Marinifilum fragile TaxID=570161 RepID=UPI0006D056AE|nr:tetratricopeptide repeat protein [Marinifilum fragile]
MKRILSLFLIFNFSLSFAQDNALEKANKLIETKKYESAYQVLNNADPNNEKPEITIAKTNLFLNYFATSIMHQMFALTDLKPDEDIMDIRGKAGNFAMFRFSADSVLINLIKKYPNNYKLKKELGYYYHEVHLKYQGSWLQPDSLLIDQFKKNYLDAYKNGIYDYWSTYGIGYAYLMNKEFKSSIPFFEKSIALRNDYPSSHYNLAYAYLYTDQRDKGIESAKKAMNLYEYPNYKADAARMIAVMYREIEDYEKAIDFYKQADQILPHDYYTLRPLLELELSLKKEEYKERTNQFFLVAPGNPTIYQDLMNIYWNNQKEDELLAFLTQQHKNYQQDPKVDGNLYFYTAVIQYDKEDFSNAKLNFEKSREVFKKVFETNHRVFEIIDSYTKEMN